MEHKIFISYSHKDEKIAVDICRHLEKNGLRCWLASRDVPAGRRYPGTIVNAIRTSSIVVLILTENSAQSTHVLNELNTAFSHEVNIIPLMVGDVHISDDMEYFLGSVQHIKADVRPTEDQKIRLLNEIKQILLSKEALDDNDEYEPVATPIPKKEREVTYVPTKRSMLIVAAFLLVALGGVFFSLWLKGGKEGVSKNDALFARQDADLAKRASDLVAARKYAPQVWDEANEHHEKAKELFIKREYAKALKMWTKAKKRFVKTVMVGVTALINDEEVTSEWYKKALNALYIVMKMDPQNEYVSNMAEKIRSSLEIINSVGMKLVYIPPGEFYMGSPESEAKSARDNDEEYHSTVVPYGFYIGAHEVTREQFRMFVEETGYKTDAERYRRVILRFSDQRPPWKEIINAQYYWDNVNIEQEESHPVVLVSYNDAKAFCEWLSERENREYRLPTELEWEYACRSGTSTPFNTGDIITTDQANFFGEIGYPPGSPSLGIFRGKTLRVGSFPSNLWGLYDMHGNVWEWCSDVYRKNYEQHGDFDEEYGHQASENLIFAQQSGVMRANDLGGRREMLSLRQAVPARGGSSDEPRSVVFYTRRGGGWASNPMHCRCANRSKSPSTLAKSDTGFRVVMVDR